MTENDRMRFMREAIALSVESVANGGGPFGAVIVREGQVFAKASNSVTQTCDPTAHAEINAIRAACAKLRDFDLSGCAIFTSCEPCPMCLGAIYWARIDEIYYGNGKDDAAKIGFDDSLIYDQLRLPAEERTIRMTRVLPREAMQAFRVWEQKADKVTY